MYSATPYSPTPRKMGRPTKTQSEINEITQVFDSTVAAYAGCKSLPLVSSIRYDGQPAHTCKAGTQSSLFVLDCECAVRRALTTPEQMEEWRRLAEAAYQALVEPEHKPKRAPRTPEQDNLTQQVKRLCAFQFRRKGLANVGRYFRTERKRME